MPIIIIIIIIIIIVSNQFNYLFIYLRALDVGGVGVRVPVGSRIFSSSRPPYRLWGPLTSSQMGTGGSFPGGKVARA
jgi:hypothetical protein